MVLQQKLQTDSLNNYSRKKLPCVTRFCRTASGLKRIGDEVIALEGPPVSSLNCDRPSHLDRGRLGVVKAAGAVSYTHLTLPTILRV